MSSKSPHSLINLRLIFELYFSANIGTLEGWNLVSCFNIKQWIMTVLEYTALNNFVLYTSPVNYIPRPNIHSLRSKWKSLLGEILDMPNFLVKKYNQRQNRRHLWNFLWSLNAPVKACITKVSTHLGDEYQRALTLHYSLTSTTLPRSSLIMEYQLLNLTLHAQDIEQNEGTINNTTTCR